MLLKPFIQKTDPIIVDSLPKTQREHPAYFGTREENLKYLEENGCLLTLETMYKELSIRNNKSIHDYHNPFSCNKRWAICECAYARNIRFDDLGLTHSRLMEVI
jgi:hypothetical protein